MSDSLRVAVNGAAGRMGKRIILELQTQPDMKLAAAWEASNHPELGTDAGLFAGISPLGIPLAEIDPDADIDLIFDFSLPEGTIKLLQTATPKPLVSGTTGMGEEHFDGFDAWTTKVPVIWAPNFSIGINLLRYLAELTASSLPKTFETEIFDLHHSRKMDAPSGTALLLGEAVALGRKEKLEDVAVYERHDGDLQRRQGDIGFTASRGGDVVGEHTVFFLGQGERLELTHRATDRGIFVKGAIHCARWLKNQEPGSYSVEDVLVNR